MGNIWNQKRIKIIKAVNNRNIIWVIKRNIRWVRFGALNPGTSRNFFNCINRSSLLFIVCVVYSERLGNPPRLS